MKTWNSVRKQIKNEKLSCASWSSDRKHLLSIIDTASMLNIIPPEASISNLRTIVGPARKAIQSNNPRKLAELFRMAETFPTHYLRVKCGRKLQAIAYCRTTESEQVNIQINLSQQQFEKFACTMKNRYKFENV